jgi:ribonuclease P protein component
MSLPRPLRLTSRREFESVRTRGRSQKGRWLTLGVLEAPDLDAFKAGLIVPKVLGNAVLRNRTKRRLREIIRRNALSIRPHLRIVTIVRRGSVQAEFAALEKEWLELAGKARVLDASFEAMR